MIKNQTELPDLFTSSFISELVTTSNNGSDDVEVSKPGTSVFVLCMESFVIILGIVGFIANSIMLGALWYVRKAMSKNTAYVLIVNQNVMDFGSCLAIIVDYGSQLATNGMYFEYNAIGIFRCIICESAFLFGTVVDASLFGLVVITFERYMKIVHSTFYKKHYKSWMLKFAVCFPWVLGLCECGLPVSITSRIKDGKCYPTRDWIKPILGTLYGFYCTAAYAIIPGIVFGYCYGHIVWVLWQHSKNNMAASAGESKKKIGRDTLSVTKTLGIVSLAYMICVLPMTYIYVSDILYQNTDRQGVVWSIGTFILYINSFLNPLLYAWKYDVVKDSVRQMTAKMRKATTTTVTSVQ